MRIGIDARLIRQTGVGRYIDNLLRGLATADDINNYIIFLNPDAYDSFKLPNNRWEKIPVDVHWHTLKEQIVMPFYFRKYKLDLLHVPYFNIPIFYPGKIIVTIHDLTVIHVNTGKASKLPLFLYSLKRMAFFLLMYFGLRKAVHIITVSNYSCREIVSHFKIPENKISVVYEGVDRNLIRHAASEKSRTSLVRQPYFLYVGNVYPHKNVRVVMDLFMNSQDMPHHPLLVLVGRQDAFYRQLKQETSGSGDSGNIRFFGEASEQQLANLYSHARALIFPSLSEGFGLPAIEALSCGCPVLVSDIPVFHELLGKKADYFRPKDVKQLYQMIRRLAGMTRPGVTDAEIIKKYDWSVTVEQTLSIYKKFKSIR